jgi:hypothetical protein
MCHVGTVQPDALLVRNVVPAADLPKASDTRPCLAVVAKIMAILADFSAYDWARADDAHFAADNIQKLRQLVDAGLTQHFANEEYAGIPPKFV